MAQDRPGTVMPADPQIERMRSFALCAIQARSSIFYWIDERQEMTGVSFSGACEGNFHVYNGGMKRYDPLNIPRLVAAGKRVSTLQRDYTLAPARDFARYQDYLQQGAVADVLDFIFWDGEVAVAGLGIIKHPGEPPLCEASLNLAHSMQPFIEYTLASHPRLRERRVNEHLSRHSGLTRREIEIAGLICQGLTNQDLGEVLGIGLGTVKTHVARLFTKLGIENRASLVSRIAQLSVA